VRVLQDVEQSPPRVVEPLGLPGQAAAILLVVSQDVKHGLPLVGEPPVGLVQVAHDVEHCEALLVAFSQSTLQCVHLRAQPALSRREDLRHRSQPSPLNFLTSCRKLSISFSSAIISSSRPTTTSSNFSRSRIFSCSSPFD